MSSVIADIDYDSKTGITTVVFISGKSYEYTSSSEGVIVKDGITIYPDGTKVDSHGTIL